MLQIQQGEVASWREGGRGLPEPLLLAFHLFVVPVAKARRIKHTFLDWKAKPAGASRAHQHLLERGEGRVGLEGTGHCRGAFVPDGVLL